MKRLREGNKTLVTEEKKRVWGRKNERVYNTTENGGTSRGGEKVIKGSQSRVWQTQSTGTKDIKNRLEQDINKEEKRIKQFGKM